MKNLTVAYIFALTIIAVVIAISQTLVQKSISTVTYDSRTINISGRQRMLSQKISKAALAMQSTKKEEDFNQRKAELINAADLWDKSHQALQFGDTELELDNVNNSEKTREKFKQIEPYFIGMKAAVNRAKDISFDQINKEQEIEEVVNDILRNENNFLKLMNEITFDYDEESSERLASLSKTEMILLIIALALLLAEALLIFRPAINKIQHFTDELIVKEGSLQVALRETREQKTQVEYLNQQAETVFENVDQGIFLLDQENNISNIHSRALNKILMVDNLGGKNFIKVLKPKLVQRDVEALEMFVKHLYNADIEESVLHQLNPVSQVEIFSDKTASIDSRHLRISFYRIGDQESIQNVLVNIVDETEAIELQRQIQENEEKNKKEADQLLSILRVEPQALKIFLMNTRESLVDISLNYENYKDKDYKALINQTFVIIHKLKGNAQIIDLELIADKFHRMEDLLTDLKSKPVVIGSDFIKILYDINEVNHTIDSMDNMLSRISEVQEMNEGENNLLTPTSKNTMIDSLRVGLSKMSDDIGKQAQLNYIDTGVTIPEKYEEPIKDMLVQLIRNTLAHGAEDAKTRKESGKPEKTVINVKFDKLNEFKYQLTYQDDGAGIDLTKVIKKAWEKKLLTRDEIQTITKEKALELIFVNDVSTSDQVDDYSGRGQGLGTVKLYANELGGEYKVQTKRGRGFKLTMTLPMVYENALEV